LLLDVLKIASSTNYNSDETQYSVSDRIFMGKNKIAQIALGRSPEDEFKDNLHHLSTVSFLNLIFSFSSQNVNMIDNFFILQLIHSSVMITDFKSMTSFKCRN
jgi:hypothetical protein